MIRIGSKFTLPEDAITQTFGILAVRGAGKSNTAAVMAEGMFAAGLPFVVVDPVGAWWGLRSSSDGKGSGLSIPIFGGRHGDIPLEETAGQLIADIVVDQRLSCVIDVSDLSEGKKIRFLLDFARRLYRANQDPLHLFLEEADDYIPQRPMRDQAQLLRAFEDIVRRGRARGLGITLITQRSAALNKNVLTQIETLIAMRTTSPQDRKAVAAWVEYHGQAKKLLESLAGLADGEAWIWSPHWLRKVERLQVRRRQTFDSAATPKNVKRKRPVASLADIDLGALKERMSATIEKAKAEDPRELKRQILDLNKRIRQMEKTGSAAEPCNHEPVIQRLEGQIEGYRALGGSFLKSFGDISTHLSKISGELDREFKDLSRQYEALSKGKIRQAVTRKPRQAAAGVSAKFPHRIPERNPDPPLNGDLSRPQQRIIDVLATFESIGVQSLHKSVLAVFSGASPTSGGYFNNLGQLRNSLGLIKYPSSSFATLTDAGREMASPVEDITSLQDLHDAWYRTVTAPQAKILSTLVEIYPDDIAKSELAERIDVSPSSGGYFNNLGRLRSLGAIDYPAPGRAVATDLLFPEGLS